MTMLKRQKERKKMEKTQRKKEAKEARKLAKLEDSGEDEQLQVLVGPVKFVWDGEIEVFDQEN